MDLTPNAKGIDQMPIDMLFMTLSTPLEILRVNKSINTKTFLIEEINILPVFPSSFRKGRGRATALLDLAYNILVAQGIRMRAHPNILVL